MTETHGNNTENANHETTDQLTFQNPVDRYPEIEPPVQDQPEPGLDADLTPKTDRGEFSYRGTGRLEGRKALVTGGDSGIGAAVAIAFAKEGADVALNYLPEEEEDAQWVKGVVEKTGQKIHLVPGDLGDAEFCRTLVTEAAEALGGLDILVNNAGRQIVQESLEDLSDEQLDETFNVNILAMFRITREALKHLPAGPASSTAPPFRLITLRPTSWIMLPRKQRSTTSPRDLVSSWLPRESASMVWHPDHSGPRCRCPMDRRRRTCRSSVRTPHWVVPDSRQNWHRPMCSWRLPSPAMSSVKHSTSMVEHPHHKENGPSTGKTG